MKKSKLKTCVTMILDQSGSMCTTKAQAVQGYNEQVQQAKLNSKDQEILCSLITFNGDVFEHFWLEPAEKLTEASPEDYITDGATALRDAVGYAINKLKRTTNDEEDIAHLVIIISDGEENSSTHYSKEALREIKDSVDRTGKWTFTYMGCDERYLQQVAREMNIPISNVAKWSNATPALARRGMAHNTKKIGGYYKARAKGQTANSNVYSAGLCMADFTKDDEASVDMAADLPKSIDLTGVKIPDKIEVPPIDMSVLNVPPVNITSSLGDSPKAPVLQVGTNPFKNNSPVTWK